jgi:hypothetical protein
MTNFTKEHYKNVKVINADFITKSYDNNDFSLIFCNPPFSFGNNKTFYIDFLFKCFDVLTKSKIKYEKNIFFISPALNKNMKNGDIVFNSDLLSSLPKVKKNSLHAYIPINPCEHTSMHACIHTYIAYIHRYITLTCTHTSICIHTYMHTRHLHTYTRMHTDIHIHTHAYTRKHAARHACAYIGDRTLGSSQRNTF